VSDHDDKKVSASKSESGQLFIFAFADAVMERVYAMGKWRIHDDHLRQNW
jgi:hypothetical protein